MPIQSTWLRLTAITLGLSCSAVAVRADGEPQTEEEKITITVVEKDEKGEKDVDLDLDVLVEGVAEEAAARAQAIAAEAAAQAQRAASELAAQAAEQAQDAAEQVVEDVTRAAGEVAKKAGVTGTFTPGPYQIDLDLAPVPKALDAQLKLDGKGALVDAVQKDGPADKAGIKPHDVLVSVSGEPIESISSLAKAVAKSEGKQLTIELLRGGERQTVTLTPRGVFSGTLNGSITTEEIDEEIIRLESKIREKLKVLGVDVRMQMIRPGQVLPTLTSSGNVKPLELPADVTIRIEKKGEQPAEIKVTRGDQSWSASEDELETLPKDARLFVERMFYRGPIGIGFPPNVKITAPLPPKVEAPTAYFRVGFDERDRTDQFKSIERRLDDIKQDIKRIYKQIDEVRADRNRD